MNYLRWLWNNAKSIRFNVLMRVFSGVGQVALGLLIVWLSKQFIDVTIHAADENAIWRMVVLMVGAVALGIALRQWAYYWTVAAEVRQMNFLRRSAFDCLMRKLLFAERNIHSGDVTSRLTKDVETVCNVQVSLFPQMMVCAIQVIGAFLLMHSMDVVLAWVLLLITPFVVIAGKLISRTLRQMTERIRIKESRVQMLVQEGVEHNAMLRSLRGVKWMTGLLDDRQQDWAGDVMHRTRFTVVTRTMLASCFGFGYLFAFVWGGLQLRDGIITIGVMTSFLQLVGQIQYPILNLLNMVPQLVHSTVSVDRLCELMDGQLEEGESQLVSLEGRVGVRMTDVGFKYPTEERQVLQHFSYDFKPGSRVAIMGETGIGKTTILRLMLALLRPDHGKLEIYTQGESIPVSEHTRINFVIVPQGNSLMSGTIRQNLQLGNPDATDEMMRRALQTAMADFVFSFPNGLDTELGEHGMGLSEGQAQRIAIARGLLQPGQVMLFDEISSALDIDTERELLLKLFRMYDKTLIFVTHRTEVAEICDEVINLWS